MVVPLPITVCCRINYPHHLGPLIQQYTFMDFCLPFIHSVGYKVYHHDLQKQTLTQIVYSHAMQFHHPLCYAHYQSSPWIPTLFSL